jgi:branched-chain amino acid transport system substrate-binding protein
VLDRLHIYAGLLLIVAFATTFATAANAANAAPFEIDVILSLTGSAAFLGQEEADAIRLVEADENRHGGIDGHPIKFAITDDQSSPQVALQIFNAALANKPAVIIGSSLVAACSAIAPLVTRGPVVYCLSAGMHPAAGTYMYAYGINTEELVRVTLEYFRDRGWTRIGAIFPTDASGQDGEHGLDMTVALPQNASIKLVGREHFSNSDVTVAAQLARLKAAAPQAILAWGTGTPIGMVLRGANDAGLGVPFGISASNLNYKVIKQFSGFLPHDLFITTVPGVAPQAAGPGPLRTAAMTYYNTLDAAGTQPDANMVVGWDSAKIVISALRKFGTKATADQIRDYIANLHGWYGAAGQYDFRDGSQRGLTAKTSVVVRFDAAKQRFVPVSRIGGAPIRSSDK